jgi:hypothetical protein
MKLFLMLSLVFSSAMVLAQPLNWDEIEFSKKYQLTSDIQFSDTVKLNKGDVLVLDDNGQGEAPVIYFSFKNLSCNDAALKAEMVLFNPEPEDQDHDKSIGVEMYEDCYVSMYVEPQFYYNSSVFEEITP